jgi:hypothetical protein
LIFLAWRQRPGGHQSPIGHGRRHAFTYSDAQAVLDTFTVIAEIRRRRMH